MIIQLKYETVKIII